MPASSMCVCVCVSGIRAQLHHGLNLQRGEQQQCPPAWAETAGPQALGWAPPAEQKSPGLGRLGEAATLLTSLSIDECKVRNPKEKGNETNLKRLVFCCSCTRKQDSIMHTTQKRKTVWFVKAALIIAHECSTHNVHVTKP